MKLLLTSSGVNNDSIHHALIDLLGKPIAECNALLIPTAIYPFPNGPYMAWKAMSGKAKSPLAELGWKSMGVFELTALPSIDKKVWVKSVEDADVLLVWGGDPVYLAYWMLQSGLAELLPAIHNLVYVGVSAGSMATSRTLVAETYRNPPKASNNILSSEPIIFDTPQGEISRTLVTARGAGMVDFALIPHFLNDDFPDASEVNAGKWAAKIPVPVYAIDDQSAIKVAGDTVEVISEGHWKLFNV
jgi:dipeptidase E